MPKSPLTILVAAILGFLATAAAHGGPHAPVEVASFQTSCAIWSTPTVAAGSVYVGSDDNSLYALTADSLRFRWRYPTGGRVRCQPLVIGGLVIFGSDDGWLHAVDTESGERAWRVRLDDTGATRSLPSPYPPFLYDYRQSSPVLAGGTVYVGSGDGRLLALEPGDGSVRWTAATGGAIRATPVVSDGQVYVGSFDHRVHAFDAESGDRLWSHDLGGIVNSAVATDGERVYVGSRATKVVALDAATGEPVWEYVHEDGSWVESPGVLQDGVLYIGSSDALVVHALDAGTGRELWSHRTGGWTWGRPLVTDRAVIVGVISASPYYFPGVELTHGLVAVDRTNGEPMWRLPIAPATGFITGGVLATPVAADDGLLVAALDGRVRLYRVTP